MRLQAYTPTRRRIVFGTITAGALGAVGLTLASRPVRAAVSLDIEPVTLAPEDGEVYRPFVLINGDYSYQNVDPAPAEWQTYLLIDGPGATGDDWQAVGIASGTPDGTADSGTYQLRGAITAHSAWSSSDFTAGDGGEPVSQSVPVTVMFVLRDSAGDIVADAEAQGTAEVTVEHGGALVSVSGSGTTAMQDDSTDPTPTYAGGA